MLEEEAIHRRKAKEIQFQKKEIEEAKSTTIEDLTMGLMNYKYVGLDFIKGEVGSLMYVHSLYIFGARTRRKSKPNRA